MQQGIEFSLQSVIVFCPAEIIFRQCYSVYAGSFFNFIKFL